MADDPFDWTLLRTFLSVAETGSLSAAGRALGVSQPTIGRHVKELETALGIALFERQPGGMELNETGRGLVPHAEAMRDAAQALRLRAAGEDQTISGTVRLSASLFVSHHILPSILAGLRRTHPDIQIELSAENATENLLFREADIAVRMYRPRQLDMVARHLGNVTIALFGATGYLDARGRPQSREDLFDHDFVGYDRNEEIIRGFREQGMEVTRDFFATRCDNDTVYWELVRAGCGLGFAQLRAGNADHGVEQVFHDLKIPPLQVWLTAHEAVRRTPRVEAVWSALAHGLAAACDHPPGG